MAATGQGVSILRYSALAFGIFYGVTHRAALQSSKAKADEQHEYQKKSDLISQAKAEWTKKTMPAQSKTAGGGVITDPEDPKFDMEAYLTLAQADQTPS